MVSCKFLVVINTNEVTLEWPRSSTVSLVENPKNDIPGPSPSNPNLLSPQMAISQSPKRPSNLELPIIKEPLCEPVDEAVYKKRRSTLVNPEAAALINNVIPDFKSC